MKSGHIVWWLLEMVIWYSFFYLGLFAVKNPVHIGWAAFCLLILASFGLFASPLTRHLSIWNKVIDKVIRKEEDKMKY